MHSISIILFHIKLILLICNAQNHIDYCVQGLPGVPGGPGEPGVPGRRGLPGKDVS